jgi:RNA polymerase sigma-70 factor (ECF subfamily)
VQATAAGLPMRRFGSRLRREELRHRAQAPLHLPGRPTHHANLDNRDPSEGAVGVAEYAFRRHQAQVYRYLRRKTGDDDDAEELTQEVFTDAAAALKRMRCRPTSMLALLYTIAQRRFVDEMRRRPHSGELVTLDAANQAIHASECGDVGRAIRVAITRLPTGQGQVVCMRLLEGCSFSEIGMLIGTTEAACKMRFHRGMRALREDLRRQGIEP